MGNDPNFPWEGKLSLNFKVAIPWKNVEGVDSHTTLAMIPINSGEGFIPVENCIRDTFSSAQISIMISA